MDATDRSSSWIVLFFFLFLSFSGRQEGKTHEGCEANLKPLLTSSHMGDGLAAVDSPTAVTNLSRWYSFCLMWSSIENHPNWSCPGFCFEAQYLLPTGSFHVDFYNQLQTHQETGRSPAQLLPSLLQGDESKSFVANDCSGWVGSGWSWVAIDRSLFWAQLTDRCMQKNRPSHERWICSLGTAGTNRQSRSRGNAESPGSRQPSTPTRRRKTCRPRSVRLRH